MVGIASSIASGTSIARVAEVGQWSTFEPLTGFLVQSVSLLHIPTWSLSFPTKCNASASVRLSGWKCWLVGCVGSILSIPNLRFSRSKFNQIWLNYNFKSTISSLSLRGRLSSNELLTRGFLENCYRTVKTLQTWQPERLFVRWTCVAAIE